jgi:hypothetical protein
MDALDPDVFELVDNPNTYTPLRPGEERVWDGRFVLYMGLQPGWNVAQRFRFAAEDVDAVRAEVHRLLRERGRTACAWEIGSAAEPDGLAGLLLERSLTWDQPDAEQTGMVLDRDPGAAPAGVLVRVAETLEDYATSERIAYEAFGEPADPPADVIKRMFETHDPSRWRRYLATIDGNDVATASASFAAQGVVLNAGSTLPGWRGRGAYRALVRARWEDAAAAGTPVLVTQAGAMSRPILERMGFSAVCRIQALQDTAVPDAAS